MVEKKRNKKKLRLLFWVLLVGLIIAGMFFGWQVLDLGQNNSQVLANIETEPYRRGSLSASIFGTGSVKPFQTAVLNWSASGTVGEININVGQSVEKDMLLMALKEDSLTADIRQAQIDVINTQNALEELYDNWEAELAQAKLDLLNAEEALDDLDSKRVMMNYQRCSDERIEELEDELERAEQFYQRQPSTDLLRAVNTAEANLNYCRADYSEREISETELEITLAEARVTKFQRLVELIAEGPDPDRVAIFETQLAVAQSRLESPLIQAPIDGVVTHLSAQIGDVVQVGMQAVRLDNLSELHLDVQVSEIDIPQVAVGQRAQLVFDAYFEESFNGKVVEIAPVGSTAQGVVEYTVRINLLDADARIKPGMTAAVTIIIDEKDDVFLIPNDAIVSMNGQSFVYVLRNGAYEAVEVMLGSYSDFYSEVLDAAIQEGELIALNPPAEITGQAPFGGPPSGRPGGFGGF